MDAFFEPDGPGRYRATELTRGPWDPLSQHAGPPAALLGWTLEQCNPRENTQIVRVTVEILRPVPIATLDVSAQVLRPGRNVELIAGELAADGVPLLRATAWRMRTASIEAEEHADIPPPPAPDGLPDAAAFPWSAEVGYHTAMQWRFAAGGFVAKGPAAVWMRMRHPLVAGEPITPLTRVLTAADSGNGVSATLDFGKWLFINTDLTVALHRYPAGEWVCLDAATTIQPHGIGLAESHIFDEHGPLGRGLQSLFVAPR